MTLHDMMLYYYDMIDYMTTVIPSIILEARRYKTSAEASYRDTK